MKLTLNNLDNQLSLSIFINAHCTTTYKTALGHIFEKKVITNPISGHNLLCRLKFLLPCGEDANGPARTTHVSGGFQSSPIVAT